MGHAQCLRGEVECEAKGGHEEDEGEVGEEADGDVRREGRDCLVQCL